MDGMDLLRSLLDSRYGKASFDDEDLPIWRTARLVCCAWRDEIDGRSVTQLDDHGLWRGDKAIYRTVIRISPGPCLKHLLTSSGSEVKGRDNLVKLLGEGHKFSLENLYYIARFYLKADTEMDKGFRGAITTKRLLAINAGSEHIPSSDRSRLLGSLITIAAALELPQRTQTSAKDFQHLFTPLSAKARKHYLIRHGNKRTVEERQGLDESFHDEIIQGVQGHMRGRIEQFFLLASAVQGDGALYMPLKATWQPGKGKPGFEACHNSPLSSLNRLAPNRLLECCAFEQGIRPLRIFHEINRTQELPKLANVLDSYVEDYGLRYVACRILNNVASGVKSPREACEEFRNECVRHLDIAIKFYGDADNFKGTSSMDERKRKLVLRFANLEVGALGGLNIVAVTEALFEHWLGPDYDKSAAPGRLQEKLIQPF